MRKPSMILVLSLLLTLGAFSVAQAAFMNVEVPENAYITLNGYDWAWASPSLDGIDLSFQAAYGWHMATPDELPFAPANAFPFFFEGANVPGYGIDPVSGAYATYYAFGDTDMAIAVPYFNSSYRYANPEESPGGYTPSAPSGFPWNSGLDAEWLAVRNHAAPVPEPGTMLLLGSGLVGLSAFVRSRVRR